MVALRAGEGFDSLTQHLVLLDGIETADRHHGGRLRVGPDRHLWIGTGNAFEPAHAAADTSLNGKVLRIALDGSIPVGNPPGTAIYTSGHRNVQGITFGPDGTMYASELGHRTWDEVNVLRPGADYGWPETEGIEGQFAVDSDLQHRPRDLGRHQPPTRRRPRHAHRACPVRLT